jgi:uncharacterized integral membrane protein (TIGR00698 family)
MSKLGRLVPGVVATVAVSLLAVIGGAAEERLLGRAILEPLVLAILVGIAVRTLRGHHSAEDPGVRFVAKDLLELAVFLIGATMDVPRLFASGPALAIGIAALVCVAMVISYAIGRAVGLTNKLAILVACGNSICGNSAIAAVAPVIDAPHEDVVAAIALTAVLGVIVVLGLPLLAVPLGYSNYQYGVLAGLTVYAVPQVLAAAFAVSALSGQVATVVKLARVLMLGPVVLFYSLRARRAAAAQSGDGVAPRASKWTSLVPPFVLGFVVLAALRSVGIIPDWLSNDAKLLSGWLMIAAMSALGLSVDLGSVKRVGARVMAAVCGSLVSIILLAIGLIRLLHV